MGESMKKIRKKVLREIVSERFFNETILDAKDIYAALKKQGVCYVYDREKEIRFERGYFVARTGLEKKKEFYYTADKYLEVIRSLVRRYEDCFYCVGLEHHFLTQGSVVLESQKQKNDVLKFMEVFSEYRKIFEEDKIYKMDVPSDIKYLDLIAENNFLGLISVQVLLPNTGLVVWFHEEFNVMICGKALKKYVEDIRKAVDDLGEENLLVDCK